MYYILCFEEFFKNLNYSSTILNIKFKFLTVLLFNFVLQMKKQLKAMLVIFMGILWDLKHIDMFTMRRADFNLPSSYFILEMAGVKDKTIFSYFGSNYCSFYRRFSFLIEQ